MLQRESKLIDLDQLLCAREARHSDGDLSPLRDQKRKWDSDQRDQQWFVTPWELPRGIEANRHISLRRSSRPLRFLRLLLLDTHIVGNDGIEEITLFFALVFHVIVMVPRNCRQPLCIASENLISLLLHAVGTLIRRGNRAFWSLTPNDQGPREPHAAGTIAVSYPC